MSQEKQSRAKEGNTQAKNKHANPDSHSTFRINTLLINPKHVRSSLKY